MDFDGDRSGSIDERELGSLLKGLGVKCSSSKLTKLVKKYDADGSGEIEFGEFVSLIHDVHSGKGLFGSIFGKVRVCHYIDLCIRGLHIMGYTWFLVHVCV